MARVAKDLMTSAQLDDFNFLKKQQYRDVDALRAIGRLDLVGVPVPKVGPSGAYERADLVAYLRHMKSLKYSAPDIASILKVETHRVIYWMGQLL